MPRSTRISRDPCVADFAVTVPMDNFARCRVLGNYMTDNYPQWTCKPDHRARFEKPVTVAKSSSPTTANRVKEVNPSVMRQSLPGSACSLLLVSILALTGCAATETADGREEAHGAGPLRLPNPHAWAYAVSAGESFTDGLEVLRLRGARSAVLTDVALVGDPAIAGRVSLARGGRCHHLRRFGRLGAAARAAGEEHRDF